MAHSGANEIHHILSAFSRLGGQNPYSSQFYDTGSWSWFVYHTVIFSVLLNHLGSNSWTRPFNWSCYLTTQWIRSIWTCTVSVNRLIDRNMMHRGQNTQFRASVKYNEEEGHSSRTRSRQMVEDTETQVWMGSWLSCKGGFFWLSEKFAAHFTHIYSSDGFSF